MKKIYLYIKESPLGLKYLGKTIYNPFKYKGSGILWKKHLKKNNFTSDDIKTTILLETFDKDEIIRYGIYYSELFDIVKSEEWANLRPENGDGGDTSKCANYKRPPIKKGDEHWTRNTTEVQLKKLRENFSGIKNPACRPDVKEKIRLSAIGRKHTEVSKKKMSESRSGERNHFFGKSHDETTKLIMKEKAKGKYSLEWFKNRYGEIDGPIKYKEKSEHLSITGKNRPPFDYKDKQKTCPHCGLTGGGGNMMRYHFDNCKKFNIINI